MDKLILVLYIDIGNMLDEEVSPYAKRVMETLMPVEVIKSLDATVFVIPRRGGGTEIECINPKYIIDKDLFENYNSKLKQLVENMDQFKLKQSE